jgi:uncharacterized protein (TIGR02145 family)
MKLFAFLFSVLVLFACSESENVAFFNDSDLTAQEGSSSSFEELSSSSEIAASSSDVLLSSSSAPMLIQNCVSMIITDGLDSIASSEDYSWDKGGGAGCGVAAFVKGSGVSRIGASDYASYYDTLLARNPPAHMVALDTILEKRIQKLSESGIAPKQQAECIAQTELFEALGIDSVINKKSGVTKLTVSRALDYIFGGTTQSDFYKGVNDYFAENGTLLFEHYCNFEDLDNYKSERKNGRYYPNIFNTYPRYTLYDNSAFESKGCAGGIPRPIPLELVNETRRKCMKLPICDQSNRGTVVEVKHIYAYLGTVPFVCRDDGWNTPNAMEQETNGIPCDKEGKYVLYSKRPDTSFVCSLDSGWHIAMTIDAETFDVPCDEHGKLYKSPNRPNVTYVCRKDFFCRSNLTVGVCFSDGGWDFAQQKDFETLNAQCDSEGKTYQSPSDSNLYYVCHDGMWTEFFNMPCDTDNMRVTVKNENVNPGFDRYICYNKTWRRAGEWHTDFPTEYYFNPVFDYGSFEDPRDHRVYRTTVFKGKTWMAENMKYEGTFLTDNPQSTTCLQDSCKNLGRFYDLYTAAEVCPEGWRLPDSSDIEDFRGSPLDVRNLFSLLYSRGTNDPHGLSFIPTGRIRNQPDFSLYDGQGGSYLMWMSPTQEKKRRIAYINGNEVDFWWGEDLREMYAGKEYDYTTYVPVRCIKE